MAYSINPNLPKARAFAMKLLICEQLPLLVVARKCGVHRSTVWRWKRKWDELNKYVQLTNINRPGRLAGSKFRIAACTWKIPTNTSRPNFHPWSVPDEIVKRVLAVREKLKRCAEVVWQYVVTVLRLVNLPKFYTPCVFSIFFPRYVNSHCFINNTCAKQIKRHVVLTYDHI